MSAKPVLGNTTGWEDFVNGIWQLGASLDFRMVSMGKAVILSLHKAVSCFVLVSVGCIMNGMAFPATGRY